MRPCLWFYIIWKHILISNSILKINRWCSHSFRNNLKWQNSVCSLSFVNNSLYWIFRICCFKSYMRGPFLISTLCFQCFNNKHTIVLVGIHYTLDQFKTQKHYPTMRMWYLVCDKVSSGTAKLLTKVIYEFEGVG